MAAHYLDELNPAQRQAVTHGDGPLLVIAGAGTGKTKTLAYRVAHLIERGVQPDRILLLTFTRRAAAEMIARARQATANDAAGQVWGGTFHAVANRLLRLYGRGIDLTDAFTVMDGADAADLMNLIRNELGVAKKDRRFPRKETLAAIYSRMVNSQEKLGAVLTKQFPWCRDDIEGLKSIFDVYTRRKREQNVLDYDDLLLFWNALLQTPGAGEAAADRFDHVLVDEYQDTNAVQAELLLAMRRRKRNILVVGDDAQSIYSFRAATIRNILDFPEQFGGADVVRLEQNYRSTQPILDASNAIMAAASRRFDKNLWSNRGGEQKPLLVTCQDEPQQCTAVCENIVAHLEQGTALMRQAVLFRAGHHSDQLEVELARRNIPFHKYGGLKFIEAAHIKDMLALLRILENPHDEISWFRVLQLLEGIGPRGARRIMDDLGVRTASAEGPAHSPLIRLLTALPDCPAPARKPLEGLAAVLGECSGRGSDGVGVATEPPPATQIERLRSFYEPIFARVYDNATMRARDLEQLEQIAAGYKARRQFIADLTLDPPQSTSDLAGAPYLEEDYLILSTIHSAKGCEWDVVHVIHAADGMIPSDMALGDEEGVEEERRLFYVALTRAKDSLYVYFPLRYYHRKHALGDRHSYAQLSRFISAPVRACFEDRPAFVAQEDAAPVTFTGAAARVDAFVQRLWSD